MLQRSYDWVMSLSARPNAIWALAAISFVESSFFPIPPDLLLIPRNGYDLKGRVGADTIIGDRRLQGMHTWDDAFFYSRREDLLTADEELTIVDVPHKIMRSLDVDA